MDPAAVRALLSEARSCAMTLLESATFIQGELPNVHMSDLLRLETLQVCDAFVGTKHDILDEASELDELLDSGASDALVAARVERILRWLREDVDRMDALVKALQAAGDADPHWAGAAVLVAESAANVLTAFQRAAAAGEALRAG